MANNIGWGQAANTNEIGFGQGTSNDIGWGYIHLISVSPETDLVGNLFLPFQIRVLADGGIIEAKKCLNETIKNLKSI